MSADDSTRSGPREVGEALVAALGFEPTTNGQSAGADLSLDEGDGVFDRLTTKMVSVDERPAAPAGDGNGKSNGSGGRSNGAASPGPGTRPNGRKTPRGTRTNGTTGGGSKTADLGAGAAAGSSAVTAAKKAASKTAGGSKSRSGEGKATSATGATGNNGEADPDATVTVDAPFNPPGPLAAAKPPPSPPAAPVGKAVDDPTVRVTTADGASSAAGWGSHAHIIPEEVTATVPSAPPVMPTVSGADLGPVPLAQTGSGAGLGAVARAGFGGGNPRAVAGDLAARVPQLLEGGLRGRSKVRARKVRRVVRHIDPWSMLTFSVLFHLCLYSAFLLASVLVWNAADAAGTIANIESFIRELGDYQTFEINGDAVFRAAMIIAGVLTLASTVMVVLLTVVFNLISDLIGGIRVTVVEEESVRVHRNRNQ